MNVAVLFRSPLSKHISHGPAVQYQIINSQINGAIAAVDGKELWRLNVRNVNQEQLEALDAPQKTPLRSRARIFRSSCSPCAPGPVIASSPIDIKTAAFFLPAMRPISTGRRAASA